MSHDVFAWTKLASAPSFTCCARRSREVARCYELGLGTARDLAMAFTWYRRGQVAADVARCYEHGLGTAPNRAEAAFWYRRAGDLERLEVLDPDQAAIARKEWEDADDD